MLPAILLSGFIFPIRIMPAPLQLVTHVVPARYFLVILRGIILKGRASPPTGRRWGPSPSSAGQVTLASLRLARREA